MPTLGTKSRDPYPGLQNKEIISLNKEISELREKIKAQTAHLNAEIKEKEKRIQQVRDDCTFHTFYYTGSGPYEDYYKCPNCEKELEV